MKKEELSNRLRYARNIAPMIFPEFVEFLGISEVDYIDYERGIKEVPSDVLLGISQITDVGIDFFLSDNAEPSPDYQEYLDHERYFPEELKIKSFHEKLRELRNDLKKTQVEVSNAIGVAQTTYAGYETGKHEPDIDTLRKISQYFKVSTDYLLNRYN